MPMWLLIPLRVIPEGAGPVNPVELVFLLF